MKAIELTMLQLCHASDEGKVHMSVDAAIKLQTVLCCCLYSVIRCL
jgi:hypothetical protein